MSTALPPVLVSAYAASPAHRAWDAQLEQRLLSGLCAMPGVAGLEVPWMGGVHPHDDQWFLARVPVGAHLALTPLPWVMARAAQDPRYGIASPDAEGRRAAVEDLRAVATDVERLEGVSAAHVTYVSLHTAPRGGGSAPALARSIDEIAAWDWQGARLVVEHCDAAVGHSFEKGFLRLDEEIDVIEASGAPLRMWLNWGRSMVELRDADAVTAQIAGVAATGLLAGLTLSGTASTDGPYGSAWADAHLPLAAADPQAGSLLDSDHVRAAVLAAGPVDVLGLKVSRRPADRTGEDVLRTIEDNLQAARDSLGYDAPSGHRHG
ncbi:MAG: DUF4862 family protein [Demequina sp.]